MMAHTPYTIWYVVADGARARIFSRRSNDTVFTQVTTLISATSHATSADLGSDKPGRSFESGGGARHAIQPRSDFHEKGEAEFARLIAATINDAGARDTFQRLALVAPPRAEHDIRSAMSAAASDRLVEGLSKDLTKLSEDGLRTRLLELPIPR